MGTGLTPLWGMGYCNKKTPKRSDLKSEFPSDPSPHFSYKLTFTFSRMAMT